MQAKPRSLTFIPLNLCYHVQLLGLEASCPAGKQEEINWAWSPLRSRCPMPHMLLVTELQSNNALFTTLQPHPICSGSSPKATRFYTVCNSRSCKGLLSEEEPHLSAAFSVYPQWLQFIIESNQEGDDKPQKQQFNLVRTKQVLWA